MPKNVQTATATGEKPTQQQRQCSQNRERKLEKRNSGDKVV